MEALVRSFSNEITGDPRTEIEQISSRNDRQQVLEVSLDDLAVSSDRQRRPWSTEKHGDFPHNGDRM